MKGIYQFNFAAHGHWFKSKVPYIRSEDACGFIALNRHFQPIGAVVFDNFLYSSAQCTLVIESPAAIRMGLLECAYDWLFNVAKKKQVYAVVAENNHLSLRLCKRVGFKKVMTIDEGYAEGIDLIVLVARSNKLNLKKRKKRGICASAK